MVSRPRRRVVEPAHQRGLLVDATARWIASVDPRIAIAARASSVYCFGAAPPPLPVADLVGLRLSRMRERMASRSERSSGIYEVGGLSALADRGSRHWIRGTVGRPRRHAADVLPGGVWRRRRARRRAAAGRRRHAQWRAPAGLSTLPRMIGRPSLPLPMTTIFEFVDCASASVASMPRQRKYESEIPWLTVFWNAAMPLASICLRLDSSASRSTRNLNSWICRIVRSAD